MTSVDQLRYPVGKFIAPSRFDPAIVTESIHVIVAFPDKLRKETISLDDMQLDTPYREGGWTIRQVVHHVADSHINSYCRFKLALTEDNPAIRPYFEERWAELPDGKSSPISLSLNLVDAVHARWTVMLKEMNHDAYHRLFFHPEHKKSFTLFWAVAMYAWHCNHHLAHITNLKKRMDW